MRRGERGLLAAANLPARLDRHHTALCQRVHGCRGAGNGGRELGQAHGPGRECLQDLALAAGVARGLEAPGARCERDPSGVGGRGLLGDKLPRGVRRLAGNADLLARGEEEPHGVCERAGVLVRDPARHGSGVRAKRRGSKHLRHSEQARWRHVYGRLVRGSHHVAHGAPVREGHEYRGSNGYLVLDGLGDGVVERALEGARGYVKCDAREAHG